MEYNSKIRMGTVLLNVKNLKKATEYYMESIGLSVLDKGEGFTELGVEGKNEPIIRLEKTEVEEDESYGLYHLALLLPKRSDLGNIFKHFLLNKVPLIGASNHGYSEAIYLEDPEGNGIEIYRDLPQEYWDIRENGNIIGITEAMDAQGVLDSGNLATSHYRLPKGTIVGHVHLTVRDAHVSSQFYREIFNLNDKMTISSGSWIASGSYHHHLAVNNWKGAYLSRRTEKALGIGYFTIGVKDRAEYDRILKNLNNRNIEIENVSETEFFIEDPDGIRIKVMVDSKG